MLIFVVVYMQRLNINISTIDYDGTSKDIMTILTLLEKTVHGKNDFVITDYEFTFGWYFYVVSVNIELIQKLSEQLGKDYNNLDGKSLETKFLTWITKKIKEKNHRIKLAIKEEMESTKFGIF